eukprot:3294016-Pleurochrysis_carterae.AAC.1
MQARAAALSRSPELWVNYNTRTCQFWRRCQAAQLALRTCKAGNSLGLPASYELVEVGGQIRVPSNTAAATHSATVQASADRATRAFGVTWLPLARVNVNVTVLTRSRRRVETPTSPSSGQISTHLAAYEPDYFSRARGPAFKVGPITVEIENFLIP